MQEKQHDNSMILSSVPNQIPSHRDETIKSYTTPSMTCSLLYDTSRGRFFLVEVLKSEVVPCLPGEETCQRWRVQRRHEVPVPKVYEFRGRPCHTALVNWGPITPSDSTWRDLACKSLYHHSFHFMFHVRLQLVLQPPGVIPMCHHITPISRYV